MSKKTEQIAPAQVEALLRGEEKPLILDVRQPHEYLQGHIPGALLIPLDQLPGRLQELDKARETVVVCRSGSRSNRAARILAEHGFFRVKNMMGGMAMWRGPVKKG